jgi:ParB/RepB/Spo0J family partition protein
VFAADTRPEGGKVPLWELGTSDDLAKRAEFCSLLEKYDSNPDDPTGGIIRLAYSILSVGQQVPIRVRDNGRNEFQLVSGHRRSLAILYLWNKGLSKGNAPLAEALLSKGNAPSLQAQSVAENLHRKPLTPIEQARVWSYALQTNESAAEVAARDGVSPETVKSRVSLLSLPPETQAKIDAGKIPLGKALEMVADRARGGEGRTRDGRTADEVVNGAPPRVEVKRSMMTKKEIERWFANEQDAATRRVLSKVLLMDDAPAAPDLPPETLPPGVLIGGVRSKK